MIEHDDLQQLYRYGIASTGDPELAHDLLQSAIEKSIQRPAAKNNPSGYWRAANLRSPNGWLTDKSGRETRLTKIVRVSTHRP